MLKLREKQKIIRDKIKKFKEFFKGIPLIELMDVTKCFIESQSEDFEEINKSTAEPGQMSQSNNKSSNNGGDSPS